MKITVEISDEWLTKVKRYASQHRTTMRALVENGLRHELGVPNIRWIASVCPEALKLRIGPR